MTKNKKIFMLLLITGSFLFTGCSSSGDEETSGESVWEEVEADDSDEEVEDEPKEDELSLEEQMGLTENEQILYQSTSITEVAFESAMPDQAVTIPEGAAIWLITQGGGVNCAVYEEEQSNGNAWIDLGNELNMTDPNTVLHGSAVDESDALYGIQDFADTEYFEETPYLYVYAGDTIREYRVFAAYTAETEDILITYNCYNQSEFESYIDSIYNQRNMSANLNEDLKDQILQIWRIVTIQASISDTEDFIVQAVPTGIVSVEQEESLEAETQEEE